MKPITLITLILLQLLVNGVMFGAVSTTQPSTPAPPATPLTKVSAESVMATRFSLLTRRSMFVKGSQFVIDRTPGAYVPSSRDRGFRTFPTSMPSSSTTQPAVLAANVVFNGVIMVDGKAAAMVEDVNALRVWTVQIGDPLADGKVVGITLDSMDYQANGRTIRVEIGHNMQGAIAGPASTQPTDSGAPSGGGSDDVLERMRKRRQQELGN